MTSSERKNGKTKGLRNEGGRGGAEGAKMKERLRESMSILGKVSRTSVSKIFLIPLEIIMGDVSRKIHLLATMFHLSMSSAISWEGQTTSTLSPALKLASFLHISWLSSFDEDLCSMSNKTTFWIIVAATLSVEFDGDRMTTQTRHAKCPYTEVCLIAGPHRLCIQ